MNEYDSSIPRRIAEEAYECLAEQGRYVLPGMSFYVYGDEYESFGTTY